MQPQGRGLQWPRQGPKHGVGHLAPGALQQQVPTAWCPAPGQASSLMCVVCSGWQVMAGGHEQPLEDGSQLVMPR